jgi:hypothetical protein
MRGISRVAEDLLAFQEWLCFMELIGSFFSSYLEFLPEFQIWSGGGGGVENLPIFLGGTRNMFHDFFRRSIWLSIKHSFGYLRFDSGHLQIYCLRSAQSDACLPRCYPQHFSRGKATGGVKMTFNLHTVLSSATPKSYLHAPMCHQFVYEESFIFHLFGSQNIIKVQALRMPKKWQYQSLRIDAINCYYTRALEIGSQSTDKTHSFPS